MRITCVVLCYNQLRFIEETLLSVLRQTRPPDEILVADDGSTDGSRNVIRSMANSYPIITPMFRDSNLGVTLNRDLAMRQASGDFVTSLDGDDYFLPMKLEKESEAIERTSSPVAYSDVRIVHMKQGWSRPQHLASFEELGATGRLRQILFNKSHLPQDMLVAKVLHLKVGGYKHELRYYEDWDYKIRLAAEPGAWAHSGVEGVGIRLHGRLGGGLSRIPYYKHGAWQLAVMRSNRELVCDRLGRAFYYRVLGRILGRSTKWQLREWRWQAMEKWEQVFPSNA